MNTRRQMLTSLHSEVRAVGQLPHSAPGDESVSCSRTLQLLPRQGLELALSSNLSNQYATLILVMFICQQYSDLGNYYLLLYLSL